MYLSGQFSNPIWADCGEKKPDRTAIKEKQKYNSNTYTKTKINTNTRTKKTQIQIQTNYGERNSDKTAIMYN